MTVWILVVLTFGHPPEVWPGWNDQAAYNMPASYARETDCWKARKRVLTQRPLPLPDWEPVAATCVAWTMKPARP